MNKLLEWDAELFLWLNNLGGESWDSFWLRVSGEEIWFPMYGILAILLFKVLKPKKALLAILLIIANVFLTDQGATWFFKEQFQRLRPCHVESLLEQMRLVKEGCGGRYGFLSAHASNSFGWAVLVGLILKQRYPLLLPVLLLWAAVVAYSRIYLGVHYPLDVICGGLYGALCGYLFFRIFMILTTKRPQNERP